MAFQKTVQYCQEKGLVVIGDIKRGDIGSTSAAYAVGHLDGESRSKEYVPFGEDFVTVNPYLGSDGVNPFLDVCKEEKKGVFVLVKTSNPSSGEFQDQQIQGRPLYELVGEKVAAWGAELMGKEYSYVGAVVGATYPEMGKVLRKIMPKAYILVPGYGAQGGKGKDLVHFFMKTAWERSSIPPEGSSPPGSRRNMPPLEQSSLARLPERRSWICEKISRRRWRAEDRETQKGEQYEQIQGICGGCSQEQIAADIYSLWIQTEEIARAAGPDSSCRCIRRRDKTASPSHQYL